MKSRPLERNRMNLTLEFIDAVDVGQQVNDKH